MAREVQYLSSLHACDCNVIVFTLYHPLTLHFKHAFSLANVPPVFTLLYTALDILRVLSLVFLEGVTRGNHQASSEGMSNMSHLLPPNLRELEL